MVSSRLLYLVVAAGAGLVSAAPTGAGAVTHVKRGGGYSVPKAQGFPNPDSEELRHIEKAADGLVNLTNVTPTHKFSSEDLAFFQLVAFNEYFETAFFSSLLHNVTNDVPGFEYDRKDELIVILKNILAEEELHVLSAVEVLEYSGAFVPSPCKYVFGSTSLQHAINFAQVFTTIFMGTLQAATETFAKNGDSIPVRGLAAVITNEAEQNGYFRHMLGKKPTAGPFPTTSLAPFLFSALDLFTVPDSCPFPLDKIDVTLFRAFNLVGDGMIKPADQTLSFETDLGGVNGAEKFIGKKDDCGLYVTYVTAQLKPIAMPVQNPRWNGTVLTVDAHFPYSKYLMTGLSLAALTTKADFSSVDEIPEYTLAAPAVMQADIYLNGGDKLGALL